MKPKIKAIISTFVFSAILILIMVSAPQTIGLSREGFDSETIMKQFFFYSVSGIAFLVGIILLIITELLIIKDDVKFGNSLGFNSQGEIPSPSFFKRFTNIQLFLLSLIFFVPMLFINILTKQQTFTGVGVLAQQFTAIDSIIYSTLLIPVAENLGMAFFIAISLFGLRYYARKNNWNRNNFIGFAYLIPIIIGVYGLANHLLRYSASDVSLIVVFFFWLIMGLLTIASGSFIPAWIMHISNNLFFDLSRFFSSDNILIAISIIYIIIIISYYYLYKGRLFGKKNIGGNLNEI